MESERRDIGQGRFVGGRHESPWEPHAGQRGGKKFLGIVGLGAIGASIGMGARPYREVLGLDVDPEHVRLAAEMGAIDAEVTSLEGLRGTPLVVVAVSPAMTVTVVREVLKVTDDRSTVIDVSSVKAITDQINHPRHVPTHPMRGSELTGPAGARPNMFAGGTWVVCASTTTSPSSLSAARDLIQLLDATPLFLNTREHDELVARNSHLPHLIAAVVANVIASFEGGVAFSMAGGGLRDTTRVARGNPPMWSEILLSNSKSLIDTIDETVNHLTSLRRALLQRDVRVLTRYLEDAANTLDRQLPMAQNARHPIAAKVHGVREK